MTCKDCLHYEACKSMLESMGFIVDGPGYDADTCCQQFEIKKQGNWSLRCDSHLDTHTGEYDEEFYLECSVCRRRVYDIDPETSWIELVSKYPYCHCGAKMNP